MYSHTLHIALHHEFRGARLATCFGVDARITGRATVSRCGRCLHFAGAPGLLVLHAATAVALAFAGSLGFHAALTGALATASQGAGAMALPVALAYAFALGVLRAALAVTHPVANAFASR